MPALTFHVSVSLDGFITGPDPRPGAPLGTGGEQLRAGLRGWPASVGALVMGRSTFDVGMAPEQPELPVFVVTHRPRAPLSHPDGATFEFVADGVEAALERARAAAGPRDVAVAGGAGLAQQLLERGLLDELTVAVVPVLLGGGTRLFGPLGTPPPALELVDVERGVAVTQLSYRTPGAARPARASRPAARREPAGELAVDVRDLRKAYGRRPVLRGLSFSVAAGQIFGIAGRNGAGKTTTVEIVQGLRHRDAGHVEVLGLDPARERARLRTLVGSQLQTSALPDRLRVGEALRLFARLAGDVVDWRELAGTWRLEPVLEQPFGTLSGGQRQRLFLALALVNRPRLVFLDELTQGLDPAARRETWTLVEQVRAQGATVVLVTHDMDEAERLCDRIAVIHDGALLVCGRPDELVNAAGSVAVRFSSADAEVLDGVARMAGVSGVDYDGAVADVTAEAGAVVRIAAELARRELPADDFTVVRPSLEDAVVALLDGDRR